MEVKVAMGEAVIKAAEARTAVSHFMMIVVIVVEVRKVVRYWWLLESSKRMWPGKRVTICRNE
jgi:hypothetical protein